MTGGHRHIDDPPPRWPDLSPGDLLLLVAVVVGGLAVARFTAPAREATRAETCALSGAVVGWDSVYGTRRAYADLRVGAVAMPAEYDDGDRFVDLGVTDGDGTFVVGCAHVQPRSVIAFLHASWRGCLYVTDVTIPADGAENLRFEVSHVRMSQLADAAHDLGCTRPPLALPRRLPVGTDGRDHLTRTRDGPYSPVTAADPAGSGLRHAASRPLRIPPGRPGTIRTTAKGSTSEAAASSSRHRVAPSPRSGAVGLAHVRR